jgi:hypothetical protein
LYVKPLINEPQGGYIHPPFWWLVVVIYFL